MQVGDLVTLSSKGWSNKGNIEVRGKMGVILEIGGRCHYPYEIKWFNASGLEYSRGLLRMKRYEIKKV
tara:strand:+ start:727 stop:930 length:204 start_codon:yes stop_codon:yes gene_type:complete